MPSSHVRTHENCRISTNTHTPTPVDTDTLTLMLMKWCKHGKGKYNSFEEFVTKMKIYVVVVELKSNEFSKKFYLHTFLLETEWQLSE